MIAAHQIDSDGWTGGPAPKTKSAVDIWADAHPIKLLLICVTLISLLVAVEHPTGIFDFGGKFAVEFAVQIVFYGVISLIGLLAQILLMKMQIGGMHTLSKAQSLVAMSALLITCYIGYVFVPRLAVDAVLSFVGHL